MVTNKQNRTQRHSRNAVAKEWNPPKNSTTKLDNKQVKEIVNNELRKTAIRRQIPVAMDAYPVRNTLNKRWCLAFPLRAALERLVDETDITFDSLTEGIIYLEHVSYTCTIARFQEASNQAGETANLLSGAIFSCMKKNLEIGLSSTIRFREWIPDDTLGFTNQALALVSDEMCATASSEPAIFWDSPIETPLYRNTGPSVRNWPLLSVTPQQNQRSGFGNPQPWQGNWATRVSRAPIWTQAPASQTYAKTTLDRTIMSPKEPKKVKVSVDPDGSKVRLSEEPVIVLAFDRTADPANTDIAGVSMVFNVVLSVDL